MPEDARQQPPVIPLVTACGRRITVKPLRLGAAGRPFARVALEVGPERGGVSRVWAGLSPDEARRLARLLGEQADRAEGLVRQPQDTGQDRLAS